MTSARREPSWRAQQRACRACHETCPNSIYSGAEGDAYPLFHEEGNLDADVLFVMEAPNWTDTFDKDKRRLTVNDETDPTGRFLLQLLQEELRLEPEDVLLVNSVLCLPARRGGKFPVTGAIRNQCVDHLRTTIDRVKPRVVAPLGRKALEALGALEQHGLKGIVAAAGKPVAWRGTTLFPLVHTSELGRGNRSANEQRQDWRALRGILDDSSDRQAAAFQSTGPKVLS